MRPSVASVLPTFQARFEGTCTFPYLDVKGLVTCGIGDLIDPVSEATVLDWTRPDGTNASIDEIEAAWTVVKGRRDLMLHGGGAYEALTTIRLTPSSIQALVMRRAAEYEVYLRERFPSWDMTMPANAQLACFGVVWAVGAVGFTRGFPRCCAAVEAGDWGTAAVECQMDTAGNLGIVPRNLAVRALFAACLDAGDPDVVTGWP